MCEVTMSGQYGVLSADGVLTVLNQYDGDDYRFDVGLRCCDCEGQLAVGKWYALEDDDGEPGVVCDKCLSESDPTDYRKLADLRLHFCEAERDEAQIRVARIHKARNALGVLFPDGNFPKSALQAFYRVTLSALAFDTDLLPPF